MKNKLLPTLFLVLGLTIAASAQRMTKDASPCEVIKGKSYIVWTSGKFDDFPDAASAAKIEFDATGKGTARAFTSYKPTDTNGVHYVVNVACKILQSSVDPALLGKSYLQFSHKDGIDAGLAFITSYDKGSKIWFEAAYKTRPMKGWMFQVPMSPPASENLVK